MKRPPSACLPLLFVSLLLLGLVCVPSASAQSQAILDNIEANSAGWDQLITDLIFGANTGTGLGLNGQLWQIASLVGVVSIFYYFFLFAKELLNGKQTLRGLSGPFLFIMLMMLLLGAPGDVPPASRIAYDVLQIKDKFLQLTLQSSLAGQQLGAVISDELLNASTQAELRQQVDACDQIPAPPVALPSQTRPANPDPPLTLEQVAYYDKLDCYSQVAALANERIATVEQSCQLGTCEATKSQLATLRDGLVSVAALPLAPVAGILSNGSLQRHVIVPAIMFVAFQLQRFYIMALNASYFLHLLILPIPLAASLTPTYGSSSPLSRWAGTFFSTMMAEFFYIMIVSVSSLILSNSAVTSNNDDLLTGLVLGIFGPILSGYLAKANASGAIRGIGSAVGQAASSVPAVGGTLASFARYRSG